MYQVSPWPKGPDDQACKSSGTAIVNGKEEGIGNVMRCTAGYRKYDECETCGPDIGRCDERTSCSNIRGCNAAARMMNSRFNVPPGQLAPLAVEPFQLPIQSAPLTPKGGVMRRDVEGRKREDVLLHF